MSFHDLPLAAIAMAESTTATSCLQAAPCPAIMGLGKLEFALQLAHSLLCSKPGENALACGECPACKLIAVDTHPDLFLLRAEERGKAIKVDDVRQLSAKLNLTSQYGGYKVAVVIDAHDMNINASNSLLKTLEEPSSNAVLILVSSNPQKLPITVRSRCQGIGFNVPDTESLSRRKVYWA